MNGNRTAELGEEDREEEKGKIDPIFWISRVSRVDLVFFPDFRASISIGLVDFGSEPVRGWILIRSGLTGSRS